MALMVIEVFISPSGMPSNSAPHVAEMGDRHADLADLAAGERMVGIVAGLGRQIEGDRKPGLALGEVLPVQLVGGLRRGMARIGAEHPGLVALGFSAHGCLSKVNGLKHRSTPDVSGQRWRCGASNCASSANNGRASLAWAGLRGGMPSGPTGLSGPVALTQVPVANRFLALGSGLPFLLTLLPRQA